MEKNFIYLPTEKQIKDFQNELFDKLNIGIVCPHDIPVLESRFHQKSIFDDRISYNHTIRAVEFFREHENIATALRMQILRPCLSNLHFEGYHIDNYGIVFDKENGKVISIIKTDLFQIIEINKHEFAVQKGDKQIRVYKVSDMGGTRYTKRVVKTLDIAKEKIIVQNREKSGIKNVKPSEASWMKAALDLYFADYEGTMKKMPIRKKD